MNKAAARPIKPRAATPPTTPPTMAPVLFFLGSGDGVGNGVGSVEVDGGSVDEDEKDGSVVLRLELDSEVVDVVKMVLALESVDHNGV